MPASTRLPFLAAAGLLFAAIAHADVTIQEKISMDLPIFKATSETTENYAGDRKRHDTAMHCQGFMSMFCGNSGSGEIVRLDRGMIYDLEPSKKRYREHPLPTEAERREMQQRMEAMMKKMKQCQAQQPQAQQGPDTSKCQMSPARMEVKNLGSDGQILGHDVHHTKATLTSSCTNTETHEVCDMQFGFDTWLTGDRIEGLEDRTAFTQAYMKKIGFTGEAGAEMAKAVQQMMAPYAEQLKELKAKSADLKGTPLRTAFRVSYGGPQCASAKNNSAGSGAGGPAGGDLGAAATEAVAESTAQAAAAKAANGTVGGTIASQTLARVGGKLLGGLFSKKKKADDAASGKTEETKAAESASGMVNMVSFTTETTAITPGPVPADRFEVPADWKKIVPSPKTEKEQEFTCPGEKPKGKGDAD